MKKILVLLCALILCGCSVKPEYDLKRDAIIYNSTILHTGALKLMQVYACQKDNADLAPIYGENYWKQDINGSGKNYSEYMSDILFYNEVLNILALSELADDYALNPKLTEYSSKIYESIKASYTDITEEDVLEFLTLYDKASYVRKQNLLNTEVSEEDYRVVTVYEAYFADQEKATQFYSKLFGGEDFVKIMSEADECITANYSRSSDISDKYSEILFNLKEGEYNGILETQGRFMVVYMADVFDDDLSEKNRQEIVKLNVNSKWTAMCEEKNKTASISINKDFYNSLFFGYTNETNIIDAFDKYLDLIEG